MRCRQKWQIFPVRQRLRCALRAHCSVYDGFSTPRFIRFSWGFQLQYRRSCARPQSIKSMNESTRPFSSALALVLLALTNPLWYPNRSLAQDRSLAPENPIAQAPSEPWPAGVEQITEARVTSTISFLASDELAGRGTGTPEFDIAAAYVAARFRGAGLEGGGVDGSFYHETRSTLSRLPENASVADTDGAPIATWGLLSARDEVLEIEGKVESIALDAWREKAIEGVALAPIVRGAFSTEAKGSRALSQIARIASHLETAGAKCLMLDVDEGSDLVQQAALLRSRPRVAMRNSVPIPVVLVSPASKLPDVIRVKIPGMVKEERIMRNVIGVLRGKDPNLEKQAVLFSAHLDHLGTNPKMEGDSIYNGADDDASGVTAVVTLADAFANMSQPPARSLIFMTFWGEESGLLGSKQFVENPSWPLEEIVANINIEMIGRPEGGARGKIWMTGWQESDLGSIMRESAMKWGIEIFEHPKFSSMLYRSSDNWSFVQRGVIAHSFSAGSLHADYHQPDDEWDRLEIPHMAQVIRGLMLGAIPLADGTASPRPTTK
jgi:hypothetical protein